MDNQTTGYEDWRLVKNKKKYNFIGGEIIWYDYTNIIY